MSPSADGDRMYARALLNDGVGWGRAPIERWNADWFFHFFLLMRGLALEIVISEQCSWRRLRIRGIVALQST